MPRCGSNLIVNITVKYTQLKKKKNESFPLAATWMDLEGIMLSEISQQRKINNGWYHLYVESKYIKQTSQYKHIDIFIYT